MNISEYIQKERARILASETKPWAYGTRCGPIVPRIICADGFSISVQAHYGAYSSPRENEGPWDKVECGYPSAVPDQIIQYCDDVSAPLETVYAYVPIKEVEALIEAHGGPKP